MGRPSRSHRSSPPGTSVRSLRGHATPPVDRWGTLSTLKAGGPASAPAAAESTPRLPGGPPPLIRPNSWWRWPSLRQSAPPSSSLVRARILWDLGESGGRERGKAIVPNCGVATDASPGPVSRCRWRQAHQRQRSAGAIRVLEQTWAARPATAACECRVDRVWAVDRAAHHAAPRAQHHLPDRRGRWHVRPAHQQAGRVHAGHGRLRDGMAQGAAKRDQARRARASGHARRCTGCRGRGRRGARAAGVRRAPLARGPVPRRSVDARAPSSGRGLTTRGACTS